MGSSRVLAWPYLAGLALLIAIPMTAAVALAFTDYSGVQSPRFTGVENFIRLLGDASFWRSAGNSLVYAVISATEEIGFVRGVTGYPKDGEEYHNLWEISLDTSGRCIRFVEWWMLH